jgi:S1-C subfamily serine protease
VEKINISGMASIGVFVSETARFLADRERRLTFVPPGAENVKPPEGAQARPRRVSLGTIPDMAYSGGDGVPVSGVLPGSPAEKVGIVTGDRIISVDGEKVTSLEDYSGILKSHAPGDEIKVTLVRGAEQRTVTVTLVERK